MVSQSTVTDNAAETRVVLPCGCSISLPAILTRGGSATEAEPATEPDETRMLHRYRDMLGRSERHARMPAAGDERERAHHAPADDHRHAAERVQRRRMGERRGTSHQGGEGHTMNGKDNPWKSVADVYYHVDCLSDVAPGDVVYLSNAGGSLMVAYTVGGVVRCDGADPPVRGRADRPQVHARRGQHDALPRGATTRRPREGGRVTSYSLIIPGDPGAQGQAPRLPGARGSRHRGRASRNPGYGRTSWRSIRTGNRSMGR